MKNKILIGIGTAIVIAVCLVNLFVYVFAQNDSGYYYVQIDNSKIEQGNSRDGVIDFRGGMDYSYTLSAYDEKGRRTDITFGTSRELREGAFLQLTVKPLRGVVEWEEVQYDELPVDVQRRLQR
ncbi:MAG: YxeA family protein [Lachnospiraceae bacterium]|nr:YxeA family protein [Lachnospiraceae bacterium]